MSYFKFALIALMVPAVAGCSGMQTVTRTQTGALIDPAISTKGQATQLTEQALALETLTRDIVRKSTIKGAAIGAATGCGMALVSNSAKGKCLSGALVGGAVGGLMGHAKGKSDVQRRVEIVSLSRVMPSIAAANDQLDLVKKGVPELLAAQTAELAEMNLLAQRGEITPEAHQARILEIRATRRALAQTLTLSAQQAREAHQALSSAQDQGQKGLHWYLNATQKIEAESTSAREAISLL